MPFAGQRSHIKEHARHIKIRNWRITVTNYRSFSKNLVLVSRVKQVTNLLLKGLQFLNVSLTALLQ